MTLAFSDGVGEDLDDSVPIHHRSGLNLTRRARN